MYRLSLSDAMRVMQLHRQYKEADAIAEAAVASNVVTDYLNERHVEDYRELTKEELLEMFAPVLDKLIVDREEG